MSVEIALAHERRESAERRLEQACDEIAGLRRELNETLKQRDVARSTVAELDVLARFWRVACEQALDKWNALEDKHTTLVEAIGKVLEDEATSLSLYSWHALEVLFNEATPAEADPE